MRAAALTRVTSVELPLQIGDLPLHGIDGAGDLSPEGVELGGVDRVWRGRRPIVQLTAQHQDVLLQPADRLTLVTALLQRSGVVARAVDPAGQLALLVQGRFE